MRLIDLDEVYFEPFHLIDEDDNPILVNYVSEDALNDMPVIDPVRHGKWVRTTHVYENIKPDELWVQMVCSECGHVDAIKHFHKDEWEIWQKDHWSPKLHKFCGDCGTCMDLK